MGDIVAPIGAPADPGSGASSGSSTPALGPEVAGWRRVRDAVTGLYFFQHPESGFVQWDEPDAYRKEVADIAAAEKQAAKLARRQAEACWM